jgi:hypothetical protein
MKYLLFIFLTSLFLNTQSQASGNFIDTLGCECGRMLYNMNEHIYHKNIKLSQIQSSRINELKTCLDLYRQYGGDFQELNTRYNTALAISKCAYDYYIKINPPAQILPTDDPKTRLDKEKQNNEPQSYKDLIFDEAIKNSNCLNYYLYKDKYPDCGTITYLSTECNTTKNTK